MSDRMKSILSRVLSQEVAHQEIWAKKEAEQFGKSVLDRDDIIKEIKAFMVENDIKFNGEFYLQEF